MSTPDNNEEAGKRSSATGPEVAKAVSPASPPTNETGETPEEADEGHVAIDGDDLLKRVRSFVGRFVIHPSTIALDAHVLWIAHTHLMDSWFTTPRLAVLSPEPGSGKSRLLEITVLLVPRPILSVQSTSAYVIRKIADQSAA